MVIENANVLLSPENAVAVDDQDEITKNQKKFDVQKSLMILKLKGIGISIVDYNPQEICYLSIEGIVLFQEVNVYKSDRREQTFTKIESSIRNF